MAYDITDSFDEAIRQVDEQELDGELLDDLDLRALLVEVNKTVSGELMHIGELSDDPEKNQDELRQLVVNAAVKSFMAGLHFAAERFEHYGGSREDAGVVVQIPAEALEQIGLGIIRDGVATFTLTTPIESTTD